MKILLNTLKRVKGFALRHKFWTGVIILITVGILWGVLFSGGNNISGFETAVVERGNVVRIVSESGKVVAADEVDLGFSQGGRITRVLVKEGQRVNAGSLLAELESGEAQAMLAQREASLEMQRVQLDALQAPARPEEIAVYEAAVERDEIALTQSRVALRNAINSAYTSADSAIRNTIDQFIDSPRSKPQLILIIPNSQLKINIENKRFNIEKVLVDWQNSILSSSAEGNFSSLSDQSEKVLADVVSLLSDSNAALNITTPDTNMTRAMIDGYINTVSGARSNVNSSISALTNSITAEKSAVSALETSRRNLALARSGATTQDIAAKQAQIRAAEADVASARAQLQRFRITAPFSGVVTSVSAVAGSITSGGVPAISLISAESFEITVEIPEDDIMGVEIGDRAEVTFDALSGIKLEAEVVYVAPAASNIDGGVSFKVTLQFTEEDQRIRSGLTVDVDIYAESQDDVIVVPVRSVIEEGGKRFVRVMEGDMSYRKVPVSVGIRGGGLYEIIDGLSGGERIITFANSASLSALIDIEEVDKDVINSQ